MPRFSAFCVFVLLALLALAAPPARAQTAVPPAAKAGAALPNPVVRLVPEGTQTLADALRQVSKQTGAAFVCEGKPFRVRNSPAPLLSVIAKWPDGGLPLNEAVQKIANAYDYEAERNGGVFLLRKRYTNPDDLPDIPAEELRLSLRDVVRSASGLPAPTVAQTTYADTSSAFGGKFYQTLSPLQISHLVTAQYGFVQLPVSELTSEQKQMMRDLVISRHIQGAISGPEKVVAALRECDQESTTFGWDNMESLPRRTKTGVLETQTVRVLCCLVRENGQTARVPFAPDGRVRRDFFDRQVLYRGAVEDPNRDNTAPKPDDYDKNGTPLPAPNETGPDTFTLAQLAEALTKRQMPSIPGTPHGFSPHEELAQKSVTVISINDRNAEALWRGAGLVYGLHVVRALENGPLLMQRPRARVARSLSDLNAAAFSAFPAPLIRLYRGVLHAAEAEELARPKADYYKPKPGQSAEEKAILLASWADEARTMASLRAPRRLKDAVYHRFRVLLEPRLKTSETERVLYRDLDVQAHDLWTLALCISSLENASKLETETLDEKAADFDKGYLTSHINQSLTDGSPTLNMTFWLPGDRKGKGYKTSYLGQIPLPDSAAKQAKEKERPQ